MNDIINSSLSLGEHNKQLPFYSITKSEPKGTHAAYGLEEPNLGLQYLLNTLQCLQWIVQMECVCKLSWFFKNNWPNLLGQCIFLLNTNMYKLYRWFCGNSHCVPKKLNLLSTLRICSTLMFYAWGKVKVEKSMRVWGMQFGQCVGIARVFHLNIFYIQEPQYKEIR